jgi:hypothetical protein
MLIRSTLASAFVILGHVPAADAATTLTSTLVLTHADSGRTFSGYSISTTSGDCVDTNGATDVTFRNSNIGPCGGRGVYINGGSGIRLYDSYVHVEHASPGCCDSYDGVLVRAARNVDIQGNVIAYSESNVETIKSVHVRIAGNFLLNPQGRFPRGEQVQTAEGSDITVTDNFAVSTPDKTLGAAIGTGNAAAILYGQDATGNRPSDSINFWKTQTVDAENNYITGGLDAVTPYSGGAQATSGCGLIADGGKDASTNRATFKNNIIVNTGQCGISVSGGINQILTGNKVISLNPNKGGNTAIVVWKEYGTACGPVTMRGNVAYAVKLTPAGYASGYWNGHGCGPVTCDGVNADINSCNAFDYGKGRNAYSSLMPIGVNLPTPRIPPLPKNCVAKSPYSTQNSLPSC